MNKTIVTLALALAGFTAPMSATKAVFVDLKEKTVAVEAREGQTLDSKAIAAEIVEAGYAVVTLETVAQSLAEIKAEVKAHNGTRTGTPTAWPRAAAASGSRWRACSRHRARWCAARFPRC